MHDFSISVILARSKQPSALHNTQDKPVEYETNPVIVSTTFITTAAFAQQGMGVGNNNPQELLDVSGAIKIGGTLQGAADAGSIRWNGTIFEGYDGSAWIPLQGDDMGNHTATENLQLNDFWLSNDGDDEGVRIDNDGNVGVGTDIPAELFHVKSSAAGEKVMGLFEHFIAGSSSGSTTGIKVTGRRANSTNDYAFIDLENNSTGNEIRIGANSENGTKLRFYMHNGTSLIERLTLESDGALTINNAFTLPAADGTNGQVLTTDGNGDATWESPATGITVENFLGQLQNAASIVSANGGPASFNTVQNTNNAVFSVTANGIRFLKAGVVTWNYDQDIRTSSGSYAYLFAQINGSNVVQTLISHTNGQWDGIHNGGSYFVNANDELQFVFGGPASYDSMDNGLWGSLSVTWIGNP